MDEYQHYVRVDGNNIVIYGFTTGFEKPIQGDVLLNGYDGRHFQIQLVNEHGQYRYKVVNGILIERSQIELDTEWSLRPPFPPTEEEIMKQKIDNLFIALGDALLLGVV